MKDAIKYLKEDLEVNKKAFKESKKFKDWEGVSRYATIIHYLEDLIYYFESKV